MSEPVTALNGATFTDGIAAVSEAPLQGMITLRGDLGAAPVAKAVKDATGQKMPGAGQMLGGKDGGVAWMSPDEVLVLVAYADVAATMAKMQVALGSAHALVVDVSDARAMFHLSGKGAREVMAKLAPVDLRPAAFAPGTFRRTRMAQVAAAFWMGQEGAFHIICFRSNARYMFDLLNVAAQPGSAVGFF